jgi:hypothetical protein
MQSAVRVVGVIGITILGFGCMSAENYVRPNTSRDQTTRDYEGCKMIALGTSTGSLGGTAAAADDQARMKKMIKSCMVSKGYNFSSSPAQATRADAVPSPTPLPASVGMRPGFRDLRWGDAVPKEMELRREKDETYTRSNDSMEFGNVKALAIQYYFIDRRFFKVEVWIALADLKPFRSFLEGVWGPAATFPDIKDSWLWDSGGSGVTSSTAILATSRTQDAAILTIYNSELDKEATRHRKSGNAL